MPEDYFGEEIAARYDAASGDMFDPAVIEPAVSFLAELAGGGAALELGIGTGRIALPLAQRGVRVHGIDLSEAMVARLRAKPGGGRSRSTIGDFATTKVEAIVPARLPRLQHDREPDDAGRAGRLLRERRGPSRARRSVRDRGRGPLASAAAAGGDVVVSRYREGYHCVDEFDVANQGLVSHHFTAEDDGFRERSIPFRYVWPSELDLMARIAGLRLRERWSGWRREPFTSESTRHVSVWEKPAAG